MRLRVLVIVGLLVSLCAIIIAFSLLKNNEKTQAKESAQTQIPITIQQLPPQNGVIPIALRCNNGQLSAPNKLEVVSCFAVNNTNKNIVSLVVTYTIKQQINGNPSSMSGAITVETLLNSDLYEERKHSFIKSQEEGLITLLPTTFEDNSLVKGLNMQIDYVEFDDTSNIGFGGIGSQTVENIREGAFRYRVLITQKYKENGKSLVALVGILQDRRLLTNEALGQLNANQMQGARVFQKFISKMYETKGKQGVDKILK